MQYVTDSEGYVTGYAIVGGITDGVEYAGELPSDFAERYAAYRVVDGALTLDAARAAAIEGEDEPPDPIQQRLDEHEAALVELAEIIAGGVA